METGWRGVPGLSYEYLLFRAGRYPPDLEDLDCMPEAMEAAFRAFRAALAVPGAAADAGKGEEVGYRRA